MAKTSTVRGVTPRTPARRRQAPTPVPFPNVRQRRRAGNKHITKTWADLAKEMKKNGIAHDKISDYESLVEKEIQKKLSTEPLDREYIKRIVTEFYDAANIKEPVFEFYDSPTALLQAFDTRFNKIYTPLLPAVESLFELDSGGRIPDSIAWEKLMNLLSTVYEVKDIQRDSRIKQLSLDAYSESLVNISPRRHLFWLNINVHVAGIASVLFIRKHSKLFDKNSLFDNMMGLLAEIASNSFVTSLLNHRVMLSERPIEIHFDDQQRLHNENAMAVRFKDGTGVYAIHGVRIPAYIIEKPETITVVHIHKESNQEVRRVMIEKYGLERYLRNSKAELIHSDKYGKLYKKEIEINVGWGGSQKETIAIVLVENSTKEPDGTRKKYFLRVPPEMRTARQAVAWTFGMKASEYKPLQET